MPGLSYRIGRLRRVRLGRLVRRLSVYVVPEAWLYGIWRLISRRRPRWRYRHAKDHRFFELQRGVRLVVYWTDISVGPGPSASLLVLGDEVLRLDCFGCNGEGGHFHINPVQTQLGRVAGQRRWYFPPGGYQEHIERAAFELERNAPAAVQLNRDPRVRVVRLQPSRLAESAAEMQTAMHALVAKHDPEGAFLAAPPP